jgi:MFS family permease
MSPLIGAEFGLNQSQLGLLTGVCVITLGYSNFIIVPFCNIFGRRATSLIFGALTIGSTIWQATAKTHQSLLGARVFNGFATATTEALMMQVVADTIFLHERGFWAGAYL